MLFTFHCPRRSYCRNANCFWMQCSQMGRTPFPAHLPPDTFDHLPDSYFPEMSMAVGTNCMTVSCPDFVAPEQPPITDKKLEYWVNG